MVGWNKMIKKNSPQQSFSQIFRKSYDAQQEIARAETCMVLCSLSLALFLTAEEAKTLYDHFPRGKAKSIKQIYPLFFRIAPCSECQLPLEIGCG
jgi:hypothetical protein